MGDDCPLQSVRAEVPRPMLVPDHPISCAAADSCVLRTDGHYSASDENVISYPAIQHAHSRYWLLQASTMYDHLSFSCPRVPIVHFHLRGLLSVSVRYQIN